MADPRPPGHGVGVIADEIADLRRRLEALESPSGTQRGLTSSKADATLAYLAGLQSFGSTGVASSTLSNQPADGTVRWFQTGTAPNNHMIGPIDVPTRRMLVTASVGEASITPADGFMIAYISFRVNDAAGKTVIATGARAGRLYFNQRIGQGISTGPSLVTIDPAQFAGPFTVTPIIGIWGQNTGSGQTISCVYNNPSLRVEIIGDGVY